MQRLWVLAAGLSLLILACERVPNSKAPKSKLNSARCISDIECGQDQKCVKKEKHPDGICVSK